MTDTVQDLVDLLDIEQLEHNLFRGISPQTSWPRVFGGQVISQALVAACRTSPDRRPHSMHAYFILPGNPSIPIIYDVERVRDGRSFATRRVVAIQKGQPIFTMSASFHAHEEGFDHQSDAPEVPHPDQLPSETEIKTTLLPRMPEPVRRYYERERPIELRPVDFGRYLGERQPQGRFNVWMRARRPIGDDPAVHEACLAYASDMALLDASLIPHGSSVFDPRIQAASLDHALWLHRSFRMDQWLLYAQESPNATGARGFSRGQIFNVDGRLVASVAQEGLIRKRRP